MVNNFNIIIIIGSSWIKNKKKKDKNKDKNKIDNEL